MTSHERIMDGQGEKINDNLVILDGVVFFFKKSQQKWRKIPNQSEGFRRVEKFRSGVSKRDSSKAHQAQKRQREIIKSLPYLRHIKLDLLIEKYGSSVQDILLQIESKGIIEFCEEFNTILRTKGNCTERIWAGEGEIRGRLAKLGSIYYVAKANKLWRQHPDQEKAKILWDEFPLIKQHNNVAKMDSYINPKRFLDGNNVWNNPINNSVCPSCHNKPLEELEYCLYCDRYFLDEFLPTPHVRDIKDVLPERVGKLTPLKRAGLKGKFTYRCDCGREVDRYDYEIRSNPHAACDFCSYPIKALEESRKQLAEKHFAWAKDFAIHMGKRFSIPVDEAESVGTLAFIKYLCQTTEIPDEEKLHQQCSLRIKNGLWKYLQKEKRRPCSYHDNNFLEKIYTPESSKMIDFKERFRSTEPLEAAIFNLIALHDYSVSQIREKCGISRTKIKDKYQSAIRKIKKDYLQEISA